MHISLETPERHAIQAYNEKEIQIDSISYANSLIVSRQEIITDIEINHIKAIDESYIALLLKHQPELIIIGHPAIDVFPPLDLIAHLSQQRIGIEFMSIGAACRTYNVLLGEERIVSLGIIFP